MASVNDFIQMRDLLNASELRPLVGDEKRFLMTMLRPLRAVWFEFLDVNSFDEARVASGELIQLCRLTGESVF